MNQNKSWGAVMGEGSWLPDIPAAGIAYPTRIDERLGTCLPESPFQGWGVHSLHVSVSVSGPQNGGLGWGWSGKECGKECLPQLRALLRGKLAI